MHKGKSYAWVAMSARSWYRGVHVAKAAAAGGAKRGQAATRGLPAPTSSTGGVHGMLACTQRRQRRDHVLAGKSVIQTAQHSGGGDGRQRRGREG